MTTATQNEPYNANEAVLFLAFELGDKTWTLGFATGHGQKPHERTMAARDPARVLDEMARATSRFGLPETTPVVSCYEAGRAGFCRHRFLQAQGMTNHVVDSSSIAVNRRKRRAKSEGLDVRKWLRMLMRYAHGERDVWHVVHVPSVEAEDQRHMHRNVETARHHQVGEPARALDGHGVGGELGAVSA